MLHHFGARGCHPPLRRSVAHLSPQSSESSEIETDSLYCGLLISSFNDGLKPNKSAHDFLQRGLVQSLLINQQHSTESAVAASAVQSPCCGPDTDSLSQLEEIDHLDQVWSHESPLELLDQSIDKTLRFVYIPTAMYALRPESNNTPGKQRQRARADGKKRRTNIVQLLHEIMGPSSSDWDIQAVTVDLDDDSVKQPQGKDTANIPTSGKDILQKWNPHFVYIEGGNTFWLHHCMEKGGYDTLLKETLTSKPAVYCGSSAGAILMGAYMETACWKGWDNPQVVPGREEYEDWEGIPGLDLASGCSFFPHMETTWETLVSEKRNELPKEAEEKLVCLNEDSVFCIGKHISSPLVLEDETQMAQTAR